MYHSPLYGGINISKREFNWCLPSGELDTQPAIQQFKYYLRDRGYRQSAIDSYIARVLKYLQFAGTNRPTQETFDAFRKILHERNLARSTINNYSISIKAYHKMYGETITYKFLRVSDQIPNYFTEEEVLRIFSVIDNYKHYTMLSTLFYACLRASELCALNDEDLDLNALTIRIKEGKQGRYGLALINQSCAHILKRYLEIRPPLEIEGDHPLFYTDYRNRWDRRGLSRMFCDYKEKAQITKPGSVHCFGRHSPATILVKNNCDLLTIQGILRHKNINSTMRYLHLADSTKRSKYDRYLRL